MASNSLLHARSMHPSKCIEGIPKDLRLRRICSSDEDFKQGAYKLYQRFKKRSYKTRYLQRAYQHAPPRNRENLLHEIHKSRIYNEKSNNQGQTRLILTFSENDKDVCSIIHKHWDILSKDPTLSQLVTSHPVFTYKRNTSIGDLLTHSHFQKALQNGVL